MALAPDCFSSFEPAVLRGLGEGGGVEGRREEEVGGGRPGMAGVGGPDRSQAAGVGRGREGQREAQGRGVEKWEVKHLKMHLLTRPRPTPPFGAGAKGKWVCSCSGGTVGFGGPCWVVVEPGRRWVYFRALGVTGAPLLSALGTWGVMEPERGHFGGWRILWGLMA